MKDQRRLGVDVQFPSFLAVHVGVEHESALIDALQQHHAGIRQSVGVDSGQRHGGRIARLRGCRLAEPGGKQPQRLVRRGEITTR